MAWHPWLLGWRRAMEAMLTGDSMSGDEAVEAGFANRAFPADELDERRARHRRRGWPRCHPTSRRSTSGSSTGPWRPWACATPCGPRPTSTPSASTSGRAGPTSSSSTQGVTAALDARDAQFGDYRTSSGPDAENP